MLTGGVARDESEEKWRLINVAPKPIVKDREGRNKLLHDLRCWRPLRVSQETGSLQSFCPQMAFHNALWTHWLLHIAASIHPSIQIGDNINLNVVKIDSHWSGGSNLQMSPRHHSSLSVKCVKSNIGLLEEHAFATKHIYRYISLQF